MLRRSSTPSALVALLLFLLICATTWSLMGPENGFGIVTAKALRYTEKNSVSDGRKTITQAAPEVEVKETSTNLQDVQNATLGFQKIFVLSMPSRSDKRDAIALSAYLTGLEIEFVDGVDPNSMPSKAYPMNWDSGESPGTIGCWRGHMNIYRKMVVERIQTALIMEDDVDWDVMIKAQMTELARGTRHLQKAPVSSHSPYGDHWDLLMTGHCGMWNKVGEDQDYWVIQDDPTVVPPDHRGFWRKPNLSPPQLMGNYTRVVMSPYHFSCFGSYGLSLSGATRGLYDQAVLPNAKAIDTAFGSICKKHEYGFSTCLGVYPMIIGIHHQAGNVSKSSDRKNIVGGPDLKVPFSDNLIFPVRLNLGALLKGETVVRAQKPEIAMLESIDISTLQLPRGNLAFVKRSEYIKPKDKI